MTTQSGTSARRLLRALTLGGIAAVMALGVAGKSRAETTLIVEYDPDPCQKVAALAEERQLEVGKVALELETFAYMTCEKVRQDVVASINARVEEVRSAADAQVQTGINYIYDSFWTWLSQEVYARLPEEDKAAMKPEEHFQEWLKNPDQELHYYVNWYFRQKAPTIYDLLERYRNDTSGEIVTGLKKLWTSAQEKLKALDQAYEEMEANPETPYADILKKYGLSGEWIDKLERYEGTFDLFDKQWGIVEASKTMYSAFTADTYAGQLEGTFSLMEQMGGLMEDSRVPGISLMGTLVKAYGEMAKEILKRANELEAAIRKREGYCIGADTHTLLDDRSQALLKTFGQGVQACPLDDKKEPEKNIYVQTEPDDANQLYFWHKDKFVKGVEDGGGVAGLERAEAFIAEAAAIGFSAYEGKEKDLATLIAVYNTPYRPAIALEDIPGHDPGHGLPGLIDESNRLFDAMAERIRTLEGAFAADAACGVETLHGWIESESGLRVANFPEDDAEKLEKLKTSYALGFVQGHNRVAGAAVTRTQAYETYRPIWPKLKDLSLVVVSGEVRDEAHVDQRCPDCAGAALDIAVANGRALCPVSAADGQARFRQRAATTSTEVAFTLTARKDDKTSETVTVDKRHLGLEGASTPFTAQFALSLFLPLEERTLDADVARERMRGLYGEAQAAYDAMSDACSDLESALSSLDVLLPSIAVSSERLAEDESAFAEDAQRIRQIHGEAQSLARQADQAALEVVEAKDRAETKAEAACDAADDFQSTPEDEEAERNRLAGETRSNAGEARDAATTAADQARAAGEAARRVSDAVRAGEGLGDRLGRIQQVRRRLAAERDRAEDAMATARAATAVVESSAAELSRLVEEARLTVNQAAAGAEGDYEAGETVAEMQGLLSVMEDYAGEAQDCRARNGAWMKETESAWAETQSGEKATAGESDTGELRLMVADLQEFAALSGAAADVAEVYAEGTAGTADQAETCVALVEAGREGAAAEIAAAVDAAIGICDFDAAWDGLSRMPAGGEKDRLSDRLTEIQEQEANADSLIDEARLHRQAGDLPAARNAAQLARDAAVCDETKVRADDLVASIDDQQAAQAEEEETASGGAAGEGGIAVPEGGFETDEAFWAGPWTAELKLTTVEADGASMNGPEFIAMIDREIARLKAEAERNKGTEDDDSLGAAVAGAVAEGLAEAMVAFIKVGIGVLSEGVILTFELEPAGGVYRLRVPGDTQMAEQGNTTMQQVPPLVPTPTGDLQLVFPFPEGAGGISLVLLRPDRDDGDLSMQLELNASDDSPAEDQVLTVRHLRLVVEGEADRRLMTAEEAMAIMMPRIEAAKARYAPDLE